MEFEVSWFGFGFLRFQSSGLEFEVSEFEFKVWGFRFLIAGLRTQSPVHPRVSDLCVVRVGGDDGELRPCHYMYVYSIESRLIWRDISLPTGFRKSHFGVRFGLRLAGLE